MSNSEVQAEVRERLKRFFWKSADGRNTSAFDTSAVGSIRGPFRESNQDKCAAVEIYRANLSSMDAKLIVLCDGMGGLAGGEEAASIAIAAFISHVAFAEPGDAQAVIVDACHEANAKVYSQFGGEAGTTLTAIVSSGSSAHYVHVGDSRAYAVSAQGELTLLTEDDTISGVVRAQAEMKDEDELDNRLLQFVGMGESLHPHFGRLNKSDQLLWFITSDGAHSIGRKALEGLVERLRGPADLVRKLTFVADALNVHDNASVVSLQSTSNDQHLASETGLTLSVASPSDELQVWIPGAALRSTTGVQSRTLPGQPRLPLEEVETPKERRRTRSRPRTNAKRGKEDSSRTEKGNQEVKVVFETGRPDD